MRQVTLARPGWSFEQAVFAPVHPAGSGQIEDEIAIHLLIELEVEVVQALVRIAEASLFLAPFDGRHVLCLRLKQACFQHGHHAAQPQLMQGTTKFDQVHDWILEVDAYTRIHGRTKRQVAAMFAEEKPFLQPLPLEPFRYYQYGKRTVHLDGCVEVEAAYYGAPPGWIGRQVDVQWDAMYVRLLDPRTGQLLREHLEQKRGRHRIRDEDRPRRTPPHTLRLIARAHKAGKKIGAVCDVIHHRHGEAGLRRIMGVLALVKKYGCAATEDACAAALELGGAEYRFVRRYLERSPQAPLTLRQVGRSSHP